MPLVRAFAAILLLSLAVTAQSTASHALVIPPGAQASDHFDAASATKAYLATVPSQKKARSDSYFEGGYWLTLWDFLYAAAIYILLL